MEQSPSEGPSPRRNSFSSGKHLLSVKIDQENLQKLEENAGGKNICPVPRIKGSICAGYLGSVVSLSRIRLFTTSVISYRETAYEAIA